MNAFEAVASLCADVFMYNRENYQYDRKQRQVMEYELQDMRIEQVGLWRKDVRDFSTLTPRKMEIYMLVTALELGFCGMALCKARVPPGAPPWLVSSHTLSVCGALMYLFLALWFGMHAFVSAQAYKVRILTQLVRLPVPSWRALEASRTYSSTFEQADKAQMLRVPFATGPQENRVSSGRAPSAAASGRGTPSGTRELAAAAASASASAGSFTGGSQEEQSAADPWGLERSGEDIAELAPDVNLQTERQRHIWLVREAAKFYQTYDAFCRISMSAGTSNLATFFCYYCMTYVLTENASPVAAGCGMILFIGCALSLLRCDLMLSGWQYFVQGVLWFSSPVLNFMVTYKSSKNSGHPGKWKGLIVIALFLHGVSLVNYLLLFRVREMQTGAVLPTAFRRVLYIDPFGWAKHTGTWWKQLRSSWVLTRSRSYFASTAGLRSTSNFSLNSNGSDPPPGPTSNSPARQCLNSAQPQRPEDAQEESEQAGNVNISFRPATFSSGPAMAEGPNLDNCNDIQTGTDIHGEKPGLVPWRIFFINTIFLALVWEFAACVSLARMIHHKGFFHPFREGRYGLAPGVVMPIPELVGRRVTTKWKDGTQYPHGLECEANGTIFLTSGRAVDGSRGLVPGRLSDATTEFDSVLPCDEVEEIHGPLQDFSLSHCSGDGPCFALVLPQRGSHLISCQVQQPDLPRFTANSTMGKTLPVGQLWLDDRGGVPADGRSPQANLLYPEEISAIGSVPCTAGQGEKDCVVVGTTARRVVLLGVDRKAGARQAMWQPVRLLQEDHSEVPQPGSFALLGNRYLGVLQKRTSLLQVMDLHQGGAHKGTWRLPSGEGRTLQFLSLCASGDSFYALEGHQKPELWRLPAPPQLLGLHSKPDEQESEEAWPVLDWLQM